MTKLPTKLVDAGEWLKSCNKSWMYYNTAKYVVDHAPTAQVYGQWISMKERMPAVSDEYIVMIEGADKSTCLYYDTDEGVWFDEREEETTYRVTKWMPLPPSDGSTTAVILEKVDSKTVIAPCGIVRIVTENAACTVFVGEEECLTFADCEKKAVEMGWNPENDCSVVVIAEQENAGAVYKLGNHIEKGGRDIWEKVGETLGYA